MSDESEETGQAPGAHQIGSRSFRRWQGFAGAPVAAPSPVNEVMIRHWCEALEDHHPAYADLEAARRSAHGRLVAPPAMLDSWSMTGLAQRDASGSSAIGELLGELDAAGFTAVVATDTQHEYRRYLTPGDRLTTQQTILSVSDEKQTALGSGHFVTTLTEYRDASGNSVGHVRFRILKFRPAMVERSEREELEAVRPQRPTPGSIQETRFFWDGVAAGELRIQRCSECSTLHHPPMVRCPSCGSYEFGYQVASGRGRIYSCVEVHHPPVAGFDYPLVVALIELEEGTRLLSNVVGDPAAVEIGMPVQCFIDRSDASQPLPLFRLQRPEPRQGTLSADRVAVGDRLAPCAVPITTTLIVAGATASRDFQDVHHDAEAARRRGAPDVFMNIMTTGGLVSRFVTDWAGPEAMLRSMKLRLGVPNFPGDTMTLYGEVDQADPEAGSASVVLRGVNASGNHVTGRIELELPRKPGA
jgi:uncharacterized OB-fold protein/acyl dehydratase